MDIWDVTALNKWSCDYLLHVGWAVCVFLNWIHISECHTVTSTLITQDIKFNSQKLSLTPVSFFSCDVSAMSLGTLCETVMTRPPPLLGLFAFTFFLMVLSHTGGRLYLPPSLLRLGFRALIYMASFTPLSNYLGSVVSSVFSNSTECWGWSTWMCFETTEVVELGRRCSRNLAFRDLSVLPTCTTSHSSHLILYTDPTTFSLLTGSFGFTNNCLSVCILNQQTHRDNRWWSRRIPSVKRMWWGQRTRFSVKNATRCMLVRQKDP